MSYTINKYPDGSSYLDVSKMGSDIYGWITFRINTYEDLWHLTQLCDAIGDITEPSIELPCLFDSQADRRFGDKQSFGAKLVLDHLKMLSDKYGTYFRIFHPHNSEIVESILDRSVEIVDNSEFIKNILYDYHNGISGLNDYSEDDLHENVIILLPDGGAYKWGVKLMDKLGWKGDVVAAAKNRSYVDGETKLTQQLPNYDFKGKDVLIIDDCLIYGGTFKGLSKLLDEQGVNKKYLAISHMTVQNIGEYTPERQSPPVTDFFDKVFTTNSKYDSYYTRHWEDKSGRLYREEVNSLEIIKLF